MFQFATFKENTFAAKWRDIFYPVIMVYPQFAAIIFYLYVDEPQRRAAFIARMTRFKGRT